jgi:phage terminase large subunit GpA-like protein
MGAVCDGFTLWISGFAEGAQPDPDLWIDQWADQYMVIPKASGAAEPGPYRGDRTPYATEPMRCLSPMHPCRTVVIMGGSQLLKTQVGLNFVAASIHMAPANILTLLPSGGVAKRVSTRIGHTIDAVPELKERVAVARSRDSRNTMDTKEFSGGTLYITTAGSANNLAEIPARYVWGDEVDRWDGNVGGEGDPVTSADNRRSTFEYTGKALWTSSPLLFGSSRINSLYLEGDQRRYYVPCPLCGEHHTLELENFRYDDSLSRAWFVCPHCEGEIEESAKSTMLAEGHWQATAAAKDPDVVSFQLSAYYAPMGWKSWLSLAKQFAKAKLARERGDHTLMQVFYNTRLGLPYKLSSAVAHADTLKARAEPYHLRSIPAGVLVLTAAVDVQPTRLELLIEGWGEGMENWVIDKQVLWGDPSGQQVWAALDTIIDTPIPNAFGIPMSVAAVAVDTGGHNTQDVYNYCRPRKMRRVLAIKGASKPGRPIIANRPSMLDVNLRGKSDRFGVELWFIGTDTAKDQIAALWAITAGPGYTHFSQDLDEDFYKQLTAEHRFTRWYKGREISEWVKENGARNEMMDCHVYNRAIAYHLGLHRKNPYDWSRLRDLYQPANGDLFSQPVVHTSAQTGSTPSPDELPLGVHRDAAGPESFEQPLIPVSPIAPAGPAAAQPAPQRAPYQPSRSNLGSNEWSNRL